MQEKRRGKKALVIADVQNDFCPSGALAVPEGDRIVPVVNRYIRLFKSAGLPVYITRDWHPPVTIHFKEFGGTWPPHCVMGTKGAEFHPDLEVPEDALVLSKGDTPNADNYSAFDGHDEKGRRLVEILEDDGVTEIYVGGLATDYCVRQTTLDALGMKFKVTVLLDAVKGVDLEPGDSERALKEIKEKGAGSTEIDMIEISEK
ncbi:MAG: nicotinamidase [Deltaproteobacteria bacterium]|nr:nicotinamidase [Deltaproteobacteria bacterium]MBZ0219207.1 nicotinamidase [Deltaproteobacteria bacterium]